jgi:ADP-heptose:LPS heptosyltransferase
MVNQIHILISRTDAIGDVCLTLPVCQAIQAAYPNSTLTYLCKGYTQAVVACFEPIDDTLTLEQLEQSSQKDRDALLSKFDVVIHLFPNKIVAQWCKQAKIPMRIGTAHRLFHLLTCNFRPRFTRKRSDLHEAQLNFKLLAPLGISSIPSLAQINYKLAFIPSVFNDGFEDLNWNRVVLLHPKSNGSGVEYPLEKYFALALVLAEKNYQVFFTGTEKEGAQFRAQIPVHAAITDVTGKWDLSTFIQVISKAKALVACSTGPYHIAGLCGIQAIGLFAQRKPIHPGRWAALGAYSTALTLPTLCELCAQGSKCNCIEKIEIQEIIDVIEK